MSKQYKVLVVDDEPDIREIIEYNLKKNEYQVMTAENGTDALQKAVEFNPDLVLLDIMMPEMDGIEVCIELRSKKQFENTVIAFLTARNEDYTQIAGFDAGADDYINKPIKPRVLLSRIKALLKRNRQEIGEDVEMIFDELKINTEEHLIYLNEKAIQLTKKEFDLLKLLASKPGKAFSRDEIFRKVWGDDLIVGDRTIDVHIRKIREKIGDKFISTMKGVGYKFIS